MRPRPATRRILLLFTDVYANGGIQRFNRTFIAAMISLDVQCDVLSMHDTAASIAAQPVHPCVKATGCAGNRWRFVWQTLRAVWWGKYDWVLVGHINLLNLAVAAVATRPFRGVRTLLIAHGIEVWYRISKLRQRSLNRVDSVLCVSRYTRQRMLDQAPCLRAERLKIFPNALGDTWTRKLPAVPPMVRPQRYLLSVTRLEAGDRYKGLVTVVEALSMTADASLEYVIVGQGRDRAFLQAVARRFGVQDRVHFLDGVSDGELTGLYENCRAFVLPSGKEGFGIVFLEAMFFGAPVIAAAEKGALDVVRDGETGLLIRFGDSVALMHAVERICGDEPLRERIRDLGRRTVTGDGPFTFTCFVGRAAEALGLSRVGAA